MSYIRHFINRLYPSHEPDRYRLSFVGIDCSGKTSLLYLLKEGQQGTVIPTIGFSIQEFTPPSLSANQNGQKLMTGWDIGTGCGMQYIMTAIEAYCREADALVWVVDSTDEERLPTSREELHRLLNRLQDSPTLRIPILILANKQDLPNALPPNVIWDRLGGGAIRGAIVAIFPTSIVRGLGPESGLPQAFDWLKAAIPIARSGGTKAPLIPEAPKPKLLPHQTNVRSPGNLAQKLNEWLGRIEQDSTPDMFLSQFEQVALPQWDHYTHIRLAFLILKIHGRQKGKDMIFKGIQKYIAESKGLQTTGRTYHTTMTYFWIQIVHFGIQNTVPSGTDNGSEGLDDEFARFLIVNPYMADGQLWLDYYSKDVIMSSEAKTSMVFPDKKPLPSIPIRDYVKKLSLLKEQV
ncbi:P-loop containing nucleoside triphosphate hydrolase protein [Macrolepiota fuliginosa MF-IS2]|uniref:P-loop containing nucleoside triphosphate hydrolase protein n=1 Tax=Macrolepiota fuliginosa MF-IS2 TaxID=1400762 RepID=A0A9P5X6Y8_9AGAR|nr:P-loop containing nucleoside triphosphate hydrolase protein [Macrolepiota fuliginosa MF-IS2]